jgi:CheY-like chemotaxis protein
LSLVKRLIEMHGGSVSATSAGPGEGATFEIRLPLLTQAEQEASQAPAAGGRTALKLLVVDDNVDAAVSLSLLLELENHRVQSAHSPAQALEQLAGFEPDLVLLDIGLPQMDGYELARRIRALPGRAPPKLVALTGYGQAADRRRSLAAGFDAHLVKPVDPAALLETVERLAGGGAG